jgi:hypothetical protein
MMPAVPARVDLVTPAEPDQGVPGTARTRRKAAALGVVGALLVPLPAAAAPAPCEQALRYAAQSGTQLMRIGHLDLSPTGRDDKPIKNVGVGDVKSALVAQSAVNAAALGRVLDGDAAALTEVLQQTAPPTNRKPERRAHAATEAGPFSLGASELSVHAQWDPRMACGSVAGEATRAETELRRAGVLTDGGAALVRVPGRVSGLSTTAMERRGPAARAVAAASMAGGKVELLGGAVVIKVVKPPSLLATMSGADGGEVRYKPAVVEVSGEGFETARLDAAGDNVELRLDENGEPVPGQDGAAPGGMARNGTGHIDTSQDGAAQNGADQSGAGRSDASRAGAGKNDAPQNGTSTSGAGRNNALQDDTNNSGASRAGAGKNNAFQDGASTSRVGQVGGTRDGTGGSNASRAGAAKNHAGQGAANGNAPQSAATPGNGNAPQTGESKGRNAKGNNGMGTGKASNDNSRKPGAPGTNVDNNGTTPSDGQDALFGGLPEIGTLGSATPIPLPTLPGVPPLADPRTAPGTEAAPVATPGTTVKISLGGVRQAVSGHAIAAKATAMNISIIKGPDRQAYGHSAPNRTGVVLDLDMGLLEVAAVAPEPAGGAANAVAGASAGLPITGPRVDVLALAGVALLIAGAAALVLGLRGRSRP